MYGTTGAWKHRTSPETRKDLMPPRPRLHSPNGEQSGEFHPPKQLSPCNFSMCRKSQRFGKLVAHRTSPEARKEWMPPRPGLHSRNGEAALKPDTARITNDVRNRRRAENTSHSPAIPKQTSVELATSHLRSSDGKSGFKGSTTPCLNSPYGEAALSPNSMYYE